MDAGDERAVLTQQVQLLRPRMQPANTSRRLARISAGGAQLLVGPASSRVAEQMKVRSSTRATSDGCVRARKLLGRSSGFRRMKVPAWTISSHKRSYSACEPSHQCTWSGWHNAVMSCTSASSAACRVGVGCGLFMVHS